MEAQARLEDRRAEVRHRRGQRDLYRAKMYGPRATSMSRMRELERRLSSAEGILIRALERSCDHPESENPPSSGRSSAGDSARRSVDLRLR